MIQTERLILRQWQGSDIESCIEMNQDPAVMKFFPNLYSPEHTKEMIEKMKKSIDDKGWGFWVCELKETGEFIGFIGIEDRFVPEMLKPAVEIGWRLRKEFWGKGYATEGAKAALDYGLNVLKLDEIISFTAMSNIPSRRVMEKIGMTRNPKDDFNHPKVPKGNPLRKHIIYRTKRKM